MSFRSVCSALALVVLGSTACNTVSTPAAAGAISVASPTTVAKPVVRAPLSKPGAIAAPAAPSGEETGKLAGLTAAHNEQRALVGVTALAWSNTLGAYAQTWANQLAANNCTLAHRPGNADTYGENLYWTSAPSTAAGVVGVWAAEKASYDHVANTCAGTCGHYTALVWKTTTKVGCGRATCANGGEVWVCNYDPQGNITGQAPY